MFKLCFLAFNIANETSPKYWSELFQNFEPTTGTNAKLRTGVGYDRYMLVSNHAQMFSPQCIFRQITETWNSLPIKLHTIESRAVFKSQLKIYYFALHIMFNSFNCKRMWYSTFSALYLIQVPSLAPFCLWLDERTGNW